MLINDEIVRSRLCIISAFYVTTLLSSLPPHTRTNEHLFSTFKIKTKTCAVINDLIMKHKKLWLIDNKFINSWRNKWIFQLLIGCKWYDSWIPINQFEVKIFWSFHNLYHFGAFSYLFHIESSQINAFFVNQKRFLLEIWCVHCIIQKTC